MSGEVTAVNAGLKDHPESVNKEPHSTWMVKVKLSDPSSASSLLDTAQYETLIKG